MREERQLELESQASDPGPVRIDRHQAPGKGSEGLGAGGRGAAPPPKAASEPEAEDPNIPRYVRVYRFTIQFCWKQTTVSQRRANEKDGETEDVAGT